jgi:hypothetical protein
MTDDAEHIAIEISKEYGLKAVLFIKARKFQAVTAAALEVMTAEEVIDGVFEGGGLNGLSNPYGGIISRIEKLVEAHAFSRQLSEDAAERATWAARGRAATRGETLAEYVTSYDLYRDEAEAMLEAEFADKDLRDIAFDAFRGRQQ